MDVEKEIRHLAKSNYWQNLYDASKNCSNISLFENNTNFSGLQVRMIYWLSVYSMLYEELQKHEDKLLTENVIKDEMRVDAYLIYRNKKHDFLWRKYRKEEKVAEMKNRHPKKHKSGDINMIEVDLRRE